MILTGAGAAFCSGMDLDNLRAITSHTEEENLADSGRMAHMFRALYDFPKVTIAAVNGAALAGGCGLATLCDFTLASDDSKVRLHRSPHRICARHRLHLSAAASGREAGARSAADRAHLDAEEAHRLGLVNEVLSPQKLLARARELADTLVANSPASLLATKRLLRTFSHVELDHQIAAAVDENARIRTTHDFREGVNSFLEKRKPSWTGR